MTKNEALKLALEALEWNLPVVEDWGGEGAVNLQHKAIAAIYEALAQPEQGPVAFYVYKPTLPRGNLGNVSDGGLPWVYDQDPSSGYSARMLVYTTPPQPEQSQVEETLRYEIDALETKLAECRAQQQEPVACPDGKQCKHGSWCTETYCQEHCEFRAPPQRKPLTDEEILTVARNHYNSHQRAEISFARAIEAAHGIKE